MKHAIVNQTFERFRSEIAVLLKDLHELVAKIDYPELDGLVSDIRTFLNEPFLFVVVGEIKAGKSSFINALLQADVCRVDPAPCTDVIQQIGYGPERTVSDINPYLRRIALPVDILKEIAIVDTPGTNTVIEHHHEITERFIPHSGLVLFVFPAKNPHTRTAWDLLELIREEWRKRVVFVLQQADLTTDEELRVNRQKVEEYARRRGIDAPVIFATSARREQSGEADSGFDAVRTYIREAVTGGRHLYLKLRGDLDSAAQMLKKAYDTLKGLERQLAADRRVADEIETLLASSRGVTDKDIRYLVDRLLACYDRMAGDIRTELAAGFSAPSLFKRSLGALFSRKGSVEQWLQDLQKRFEEGVRGGFEDVVAEGAGTFITSFRTLTDGMIDALGRADATRLQNPGMLVDFGAKRDETIADIRRKVKELAAEDVIGDALAADPGRMPGQLIGGSALTIVGAILLTTHMTLLDITGGILTGLGVIMAGGVLLVKKSKMLREIDQKLQEARTRFENRLLTNLSAKFDLVHENIRRSTIPFIEDVQSRQEKLGPLMDLGARIQARMLELTDRLDAALRG